jgi:hypothetical protein
MKKPAISILICFFITGLSFAQTKTDTLRIEKPLNFSNFFNYSVPESEFLNDYDLLKLNTSFLDSTSIWLQTRMMLSGMVSHDYNKGSLQTNILNPLSQKYASIQSAKTWKYILGTVQVGAVGYLAYMHIKKYGFLKKK